uniref:Uncharacterized protein n=1 Tax=Ditylenchus dipsaci TaxID=166011 RepID=A0A915DMX9_9BILA
MQNRVFVQNCEISQDPQHCAGYQQQQPPKVQMQRATRQQRDVAVEYFPKKRHHHRESANWVEGAVSGLFFRLSPKDLKDQKSTKRKNITSAISNKHRALRSAVVYDQLNKDNHSTVFGMEVTTLATENQYYWHPSGPHGSATLCRIPVDYSRIPESVVVYNVTDGKPNDKRIYWSAPKTPNGYVLAYRAKLIRDDGTNSISHAWSREFCVLFNDFEKDNGLVFLGLLDGHYTLETFLCSTLQDFSLHGESLHYLLC